MRSVVRQHTPRCPRCRLPPRWCICAAHREITCPLAIDVLMHHREVYRPSSTGGLIQRLVPDSRVHVWRRERRLGPAEVRRPDRELWILHPQGESLPESVQPRELQVLLLDGSWRESVSMAQDLRGWGRLVSLPMTGESRYWLRTQNEPGRFSTVEALLFLLQRLGLEAEHAALQAQFELHVYASLRARGKKEAAAELLQHSPIAQAFPAVLAQLNVRRPNE